MSIITPSEAKKFAAAYASGFPLSVVATRHGRSISGIYKTLVRLAVPLRTQRKLTDIQRRDIIERYAAGDGCPRIAKEFHLSVPCVWRLVKDSGLIMRTGRDAQHPLAVNEEFFDHLTKLSAYWLGFIAADGCVHIMRNGTTKLSIDLSSRDRTHLETFRADIKALATVCRTDSGRMSRIVVNSPRIAAALQRHGIVPNKTYGFDYPKTLPQNVESHFIRGYFDGDGCVSIRSRPFGIVNFSGHCQFLLPLRERLNRNVLSGTKATGCWAPDLRCADGIGQLVYGGRRVILALYTYLYRDATRYLERKHALFRLAYDHANR